MFSNKWNLPKNSQKVNWKSIKVGFRKNIAGILYIRDPKWHGLVVLQWSRKLFLACGTKCLAGPRYSAGHYKSCQTFFPVDDWPISVVICIESFWTKCSARSELSVGHQQKSDGHAWHISWSLSAPDFWLLTSSAPGPFLDDMTCQL